MAGYEPPRATPTRPVDRRTFLRELAVASAATATPALIGPEPVQAEAPLPPVQQPVTEWKRAPCRLCGVGCGLLVGVSKGRAVAVKGDPDSPVSKGLLCAKGYNVIQVLYGRDRLTRALVGADGTLVPAPLGQAFDLVARRLRETIERHGPDSVALYGSGQWTIPDAYVAAKLFRGAIGTGQVDTSTRLHSASAIAGLRTSFGLDGAVGGYDDVEHADVIVLWDTNLAESDPVLFSRMLERRRLNPAVRIIDVATRTTRTSYAADHSLLHAPHAALAIANGVCHEIVTRRWAQRGFLDRYVAFKRGRLDFSEGETEGSLVPERPAEASWSDYVTFLRDYEPERAAAWSGLAAANIRWLASLYGDPLRKVLSVWGQELDQDIRGTWANNALHNIHLLVGKVASPGNGTLCLSGQPGGGCGVHEAGALAESLPRGLVEREDDRRRAADIWGVPADRIRPGAITPALGLFHRIERGEIRFLWIQSTDPLVSLPNLDRYRRAAARDGLFLVVSDSYPTPTTQSADVVLPSAMWLEREGLTGNAERWLQHFERVVAPPGEATADAWQMIEVARRLGHGELFGYQAGTLTGQVWEEYRRFHTEAASELPPLEALRTLPGVRWPHVSGEETRWRYSAKHDPAADAARGEFDFYGHPDHRAWIWLRPYTPPAEAPDSAFPFWLTTGVVLEHSGSGSQTRRVQALRQAAPHAYAEINRDDARDLGIRNRELVRLVSRRGAMELEARIDYRSQPPRGVVFVPTFDAERLVNRLMLDAACPLSGQPDSGKCAVRLERGGTRASSGA